MNKIGDVRKGWKLNFIARGSCAPASLNTGAYVEVTLRKGQKDEHGSPLPALLTRYPALYRGRRSLYTTIGGVAKDASGVELKERG